MIIPSAISIMLFLAAFVLSCFQYYRMDPTRRIANARFVLMAGALVLIFADALIGKTPGVSVFFFILAALWLAAAIYYLRLMPPPKTH